MNAHMPPHKPDSTAGRTASRRLAFAAVIAALTVIFLYIGSLTVLDMSAVVICALLTMLVVVESGSRTAWLTAAAAGVLALLLLPSKLLAVLYICFGGIYPILKAHLEKYAYWISWIIKISLMDSMLILVIVLSRLVFVAEDPFFDYSWIVLLAASVIFVVYDLALTTCVTAYITRIRKRLGLKNLF